MTRTSSVSSWAPVILLLALVAGATAVSICNIESDQLKECRPAVTGKSPKPPTKRCCSVVRQANLPCLCNFKSVLPSIGIDPALAMALPKKCGLKNPENAMLFEAHEAPMVSFD